MPFLELSQKIEKEAIIAEDNLKYLLVLKGPCQMLACCSIRDIPKCYPSILCSIRMIWKLSCFYNTSEKITNLLCLVLSLYCYFYYFNL
jgi:dynein heavy chain